MKRLWKVLAWLFAAFVVAAILFPVFAPVGKTRNRRTPCLVSTKLLAVAMQIYASDFDDRFPPAKDWTDVVERNERRSIVRTGCPLLTKGSFGYAFNLELSGAKTPPNAESVPLIFETAKRGRNLADEVESLPRPGRHDGLNYIAYADGHVRAVAP